MVKLITLVRMVKRIALVTCRYRREEQRIRFEIVILLTSMMPQITCLEYRIVKARARRWIPGSAYDIL
jgi:hypothetical protein